ncbi:ATP-dependent DNA helicase PcrA [Candidatus Kaiserbacteria bacterium CG10_big_fil_rev_8_21_14_0_10_51_14]|uniref:DNA 3'-5' helicase n=1 Tax=Candidatus Kaiserbacteria bacterium CG10_big_fil_rev_8_21_14_0_10_51_14 TaxID=1974610 RepID=A0A2H0UCR5_9BACT|nr:MAG: ATP-dependent DNA helicase PcrA [Candidatus Kaiserbacteria bacterium CG10_big_fil_rev_8_21_14_0_10_51_14]
MDYLRDLNEAQRQAVLHKDGPLLIVAGAGAGKTKTITHRIAHLINNGIAPSSILALTFTNKAAGEMRERIRDLLKDSRRGMPYVATFHSLGVRILREFYKEAGIPRGFSIWDRDDSLRAVKIELKRLDCEEWTPRQILGSISHEKGSGKTLGEYREHASTRREQMTALVWERYERALLEEESLDFDDLLVRTLSLLHDVSEIRSLLQNRWHYLTVDEYQDTSNVQYELIKYLSGDRHNICVVGDLDQCIYTWRQADIENLLSFERLFPNVTTVRLEQNYRSTRTILAAANAVIEKNFNRVPKTLFSENETGDPIMLYGASDERYEAWFVVEQATALIDNGVPASEIAVLYRENAQSRVLEEALLHAGIPYRVLGTRFFERKEVKDVLSYLRAALNPKGTSDLVRIVGVPPRGIGKVTLEKMLSGSPLGGAEGKVRRFRETLAKIRHAIHTLPASEAVRFCIEASGIQTMYAGKTEEDVERLGNVRELANLATKYEHDEPPSGIERLLEEAALQSEQDELDIDTSKSGISLMTVHASKGLEFDAVFIVGLEQGLFPSLRNDESRDPEEERRLFYVALTRARKHLFLSFAHQRSKYGTRESALPSEFLSDIDERLLVGAEGREAPQKNRGLLDDYYEIR